jgi:hypothetical protein
MSKKTSFRLADNPAGWRNVPSNRWTGTDISARRLWALLTHWANADRRNKLEDVLERFRDIFWPAIGHYANHWHNEGLSGDWSEGFLVEVDRIVGRIRSAWTETDPDLRYQKVVNLHFDLTALHVPLGCTEFARQDLVDLFPQFQSSDPLNRVVRLLHESKCCKFCRNPECPSPYYKGRGNRYCSADCAAEGDRAKKLKWWNAHKENLRPVSKGNNQ